MHADVRACALCATALTDADGWFEARRSERCDVSSQTRVTDAAVVCWAQVLWLHYLERFRNLQYLEAQLDSYQR